MAGNSDDLVEMFIAHAASAYPMGAPFALPMAFDVPGPATVEEALEAHLQGVQRNAQHAVEGTAVLKTEETSALIEWGTNLSHALMEQRAAINNLREADSAYITQAVRVWLGVNVLDRLVRARK